MKPETAQAILAHVQKNNVPARMNVATAERVITVWLRAIGWQQDRYGNFLNPESAKDRYHFAKQVLQRQEKDGEWRNRTSTPMIDAAGNLIRAAAQLAGDQEVLAKFTAVKEARKADVEKRVQKAASDRQKSLAHKIALKEFASTHRKLISAAFLGKLTNAESVMMRGEFEKAYERWLQHLTSGGEAPDDGQFMSADNPPVMPVLDPRQDHELTWTETVDGVEYTVFIRTANRGEEAEVQIGKAAATGMQVSAVSHQLTMSQRDAKGDAYVTGRVFHKAGKFGAALFLIMAGEKKKGAGTRAMSIWCRLMSGYGIDRWVAQAVGPEGAAFMQALDKKGLLKLLDTQGAHWVVSCSKANPARKKRAVVALDPAWNGKETPKYAYHVTPKEFLPEIAEHGLLPTEHRSLDEPGIFVEDDEDEVEIYMEPGRTAMLRFPVDGFSTTKDGEYVLYGVRVDPSTIEVRRKGGVWKKLAEVVVSSKLNAAKNPARKARSSKCEPHILWHQEGETAYLDEFEIPDECQGKGIGRLEYTRWEGNLPGNVRHVRLWSAANLGFWEAMGFSHAIDADEDDDDQDDFYHMIKGVNGAETPSPVRRNGSPNPARNPVPGFDERVAYAKAVEEYANSLPDGVYARICVVARDSGTEVHEVRRYNNSAEAARDRYKNNAGGVLVHKPKAMPSRNPAEPRTTFTTKDAQDAAAILGIDFAQVPFDVEQFRRGMVVELEHGRRDPKTNVTNDTLMITAMIAWAHLNEIPDYYYRLAAMESEGKRHQKTPTQKPKVGIRPTQVTEGSIFKPRQKPGFLVYGTDAHGRKIGYAVKDKAQAEAIRDEFKAGKPGYRHRASELLQGQQIDAYYANPAHPERVVVEKGMLVQFVFPASHLALSMYSDAPVSFWIKFQLFAADTGKPATGDYRGQGTVVDRDGKHYLLLGDPNRKAYLDEYIIADEADPESIKALDEFEAGVKAAIGEFKPGRRMKNKGQNWLDGYDQSMRYRKQVDSGKQNPAVPCPCQKNPARAANLMFDKLDEAVLKALSKSGPGTVRDAIWQSATDNFWDWTNNVWKDEHGTVPMARDVGNSLKRLQHRGLVYSHDSGGTLAVWNRGSQRKGGSTYKYWSTREQLVSGGYSENDLPRGK